MRHLAMLFVAAGIVFGFSACKKSQDRPRGEIAGSTDRTRTAATEEARPAAHLTPARDGAARPIGDATPVGELSPPASETALPSVELPASVSTAEVQPAPVVTITEERLFLAHRPIADPKGGRVDAKAKRDGADGFLVSPLFDALRSEGMASRLRQPERTPGSATVLSIRADRKVTYRALAEVMFTAAQAKYNTFQLIAQGARKEGTVAVLVDMPALPLISRPGAGAQTAGLNLRVILLKQGIFIRSSLGPECPADVPESNLVCFMKDAGKLTDAVLARLQHHMWYLFANKYKDPQHHATPDHRWAITVLPDPATTYEDLVASLDALREIPHHAQNPAPKKPIPAEGCLRVFDAKSQQWSFPSDAGESVRDIACMYYRVALGVGPS